MSIPPQAYCVRRIGGPHVRVCVLVSPGQSHHSYEPTPRQIADLAAAGLYFRIGLPFEARLLDKVGRGGRLETVDIGRDIPRRRMEHSCIEHKEEAGAEPAPHGSADPHIWLDPVLLKQQVRVVGAALARRDPAHADEFQRNLEHFQAELDRVHERVSRLLAPFRGREFFVFHPAYGYFADRYGLIQVAVEAEGKEPTGRHLTRIVERARKSGARTIFVHPQFATAGARVVAEAIGASVVPLDPLAEDVIRNFEDMAKKLAAALGPTGEGIGPAANASKRHGGAPR